MYNPIQNTNVASVPTTRTRSANLPAVVIPSIQSLQLPPLRLAPNPDYPSLIRAVDNWIASHNATLEMIEEQARLANDAFLDMKSQLHTLLESPPAFTPVPDPPQCIKDQRSFALQAVDFPANPLFIKRKFTISVRIISRNGQTIQWPRALTCCVRVRKVTADFSEITTSRAGRNHAGKPILRGITRKTFSAGEQIEFPGLVFADISSQFPQGRVAIEVQCIGAEDIKPLVVMGVRVKARKKRPDECY